MAKRTKAALKADKLEVVADRGYFKSEEILACEEAGITVTLPKPQTSGIKAKGRFGKQDFVYIAEDDVYRSSRPRAPRLALHKLRTKGRTFASLLDTSVSQARAKGKSRTMHNGSSERRHRLKTAGGHEHGHSKACHQAGSKNSYTTLVERYAPCDAARVTGKDTQTVVSRSHQAGKDAAIRNCTDRRPEASSARSWRLITVLAYRSDSDVQYHATREVVATGIATMNSGIWPAKRQLLAPRDRTNRARTADLNRVARQLNERPASTAGANAGREN